MILGFPIITAEGFAFGGDYDNLLVSRLSAGPYLEMFARESRPGWDALGDQATLFDGGVVATRRQLSNLLRPPSAVK